MSENKHKLGFNVLSFVKGSPEEKDMTIKNVPVEIVSPVPLPKKRGRKLGKSSESDSVSLQPIAQSSMSYVQQNIPYDNCYKETNDQLDDTIAQLNSLGLDVMGDIQLIRAAKTYKNKHMVLSNLVEQATGILNAKLSAIKEKNKVINDVQNLELKRLKDLKIDATEEDADTKIANMYSAFVSMPLGTMSNGNGLVGNMAPSQQNMLMMGALPDMPRGSIMPQDYNNADMSSSWQSGLDPAQQRMLLQAKGAIDICVIYDNSNGSRRFAAIDKNTRQEVPGVELPSQESVWELSLNLAMGLAKDSNRGITYPIIIMNNEPNSSMSDY